MAKTSSANAVNAAKRLERIDLASDVRSNKHPPLKIRSQLARPSTVVGHDEVHAERSEDMSKIFACGYTQIVT